MRRTLQTALLTLSLFALTAPVALAAEGHDGGEGLWGETNDKVPCPPVSATPSSLSRLRWPTSRRR